MSRKDFQVIATMLGDMGRQMGDGTWDGALKTAVSHLRGTNAQFNADKFCDWANEVRAGVRDIDGRKRR